jgi:hypothetical protein
LPRPPALLALLALVAACRGTPPAPTASISAEAPSPAAPAPTLSASAGGAFAALPDGGSPLCAAIVAGNAARLDGSLDEAFRTPCYPTPGGAWALRVDDWHMTDDAGIPRYQGAWTLVHLDRTGAQVAARPGPASVYALSSGLDDRFSMRAVQTWDYDDDGEPEILVSVSHKAHEGPYTEAAVVATFQGGAVREMPGLPKAYEELEDRDGDGRPDAVYHPYAFDSVAGSGFEYHAFGPSFIAHALPGGRFSLDDAAARAHVAAQCPQHRPLDGGPDPANPELCALLRGASEQKAIALLDKHCKRPTEADPGCVSTPGVCCDYFERRSMLGKAPPFHLPP